MHSTTKDNYEVSFLNVDGNSKSRKEFISIQSSRRRKDFYAWRNWSWKP